MLVPEISGERLTRVEISKFWKYVRAILPKLCAYGIDEKDYVGDDGVPDIGYAPFTVSIVLDQFMDDKKRNNDYRFQHPCYACNLTNCAVRQVDRHNDKKRFVTFDESTGKTDFNTDSRFYKK